LVCVALGASLALAAASAAAQTEQPALALNRYEPSFSGDRLLGVAAADANGTGALSLSLFADYAHNPLVLRQTDTDADIGSIVGSQLYLHLNGTYTLWERLSLNVSVPFAVVQAGDAPTVGATSYASPDSAELGDVRAGARVRLLGEEDGVLQLAVGAYAWLPTGASDSFVSDGRVRAMPLLLGGGKLAERFFWSASVGTELRPAQQVLGTKQGAALRWGAGAGAFVDGAERLTLALEYYGAAVLRDLSSRTLNGELLASARYRFLEDFEAGIGAGPGIGTGVGTPELRGVALLAYTPRAQKAPADRDQDGIADDSDACPDEAGHPSDDPALHGCPLRDRDGDGVLDGEDACPNERGVESEDPGKHGCPVRDRDGDGIADDEDACPDVAGVASEVAAEHGCPPDKDGDGIADAGDACPDIKGVPSADLSVHGCPPDSDGDGFRDDQEACPNEKGVADADPAKHGCPKSVRVTDTEITILQQVQFDTGKATIQPVSNELLDEVASVFKDHPEILRVEVQGHTDNRGARALNTRLSKDRAEAVRQALVQRGIAPERLTAQGYGPEVPIADNRTADGRAQNRRVQFKILEKAEKKP
jgi:outer membrane protein OmpA-like peptidoglycan-associated protein